MAWLGCNTQVQEPITDFTIIIDRTDGKADIPTADYVVQVLGLKREIFAGARVTVTSISDKDLNERSVIDIAPKSKWTSNVVERDGEMRTFESHLQNALDKAKIIAPCGKTIAYRTIAREANALAASHAGKKYLLVHSNLYENNGEINLYQSDFMRKSNVLAERLAKTLPLDNLKGIKIFLLYDPVSFSDNKRYMWIATMYQNLLEKNGAEVKIDTKFSLP